MHSVICINLTCIRNLHKNGQLINNQNTIKKFIAHNQPSLVLRSFKQLIVMLGNEAWIGMAIILVLQYKVAWLC